MSDPGFRPLGSRTLVAGGFLYVERMHLVAPDGSAVDRAVVRHPGAVAVVPYIDGDVVMIRQYRAPTGGMVLEVPAGKLDEHGEARDDAARREVEEEVGWRCGRLVPLCSFWTGPGFTDEYMWVYLALDLTPGELAPVGAEEKVAEVVQIPLDDALGMIDREEIVDAKSIVGLYATARWLARR